MDENLLFILSELQSINKRLDIMDSQIELMSYRLETLEENTAITRDILNSMASEA